MSFKRKKKLAYAGLEVEEPISNSQKMIKYNKIYK